MDLRDFRQRQKTTTSFDSNSITPGTEFMERLSQALRYYVINRVSTDPGLCVCVCVCVASAAPRKVGRRRCCPHPVLLSTSPLRLLLLMLLAQAGATFTSSSQTPTCRARASTR